MQLRVRMGLHAGEAADAPTCLVGYDRDVVRTSNVARDPLPRFAAVDQRQ